MLNSPLFSKLAKCAMSLTGGFAVCLGLLACSTGSGGKGGGSPGVLAVGNIKASSAVVGTPLSQTSAWCQVAGRTQAVLRPGILPLFSTLCVNGQATKLFSDSLVGSAYTGSGDVALSPVQPAAASGNVVRAVFGFGIKMGLSAEGAFVSVAPLSGLMTFQTQKIAAEGANPGGVSVQPVAGRGEAGWVRGWLIAAPSTMSAGFQSINVDYSYETDQYQLGQGLYLETSTLQRTTAMIDDYQILTAMLNINGFGYQLTLAQVAANDYGAPDLGAKALNQVVSRLAQFTFAQSKGR